MFPIIHTIDDILPHIKDKDEFIIAQRDWGHVINYMVQSPNTWGDSKDPGYSFRRECRGIKFNQTGLIIARPLHKFWNLNERDETQIKNIDMNQLHVVLSKVDGSMVHPIVTNKGIIWMTKMGITDVANLVPKYIDLLPSDKAMSLRRFIYDCHESNNTPIFEFCSRQSRVVIDHPKDKLILIAIRHLYSGAYVPYEAMQRIAFTNTMLDVVRQEYDHIDDLKKFQDDSLQEEGIEGYVIRFNSGEMLKQKTEWYLAIHRAKDAILYEKNVIAMLLDENLDDIKANLLVDDRHRLEKFEDHFKKDLMNNIKSIYWEFCSFVEICNKDKREFAINHAPNISQKMMKSIIFSMWDHIGEGYDRNIELLTILVKSLILKYTSSSTKVDQVRWLWNDRKWTYIENHE